MENLHREIDPFSTGLMQEDGFKSAAAPECKGQLGWVYRNGFCYMFSRYKVDVFFFKKQLLKMDFKLNFSAFRISIFKARHTYVIQFKIASIFTERSKTDSTFIIIPVIKLKSINSSGSIYLSI